MDALRRRPHLDFYQQWHLSAFSTLSRSRSSGFSGPEPISVSEMKSYCEMHDVRDLEERRKFLIYMQALDSALLSTMNDEDDSDSEES